jgi:hypothetical protein
MLKSKTHFEQVPLEIVRKIVEEQILGETAIELERETRRKALEEQLVAAQEQAMTKSRTDSQVG